jgi:hypothetical protein
VLILVALGMTVFLLFVGLVVDYGLWLVTQRDMRAVADAAAQAGVSEVAALPVTAQKQTAAAEHAMLYLNDELGLGLGEADIASAAAAAMSPDGFDGEDGTSYTGPDRFTIRTPVTGDVSCTGRDWGKRAITVRIHHAAPRFFSRLIFGDTQQVGVCATSAVQGGGYAVAVLKPPPSDERTQVPKNANITMKFGGTESFVRVCGGDVAVNSLFFGGPEPPPHAPVNPAFVKFLNGNSTDPEACLIDNDNHMVIWIDQPSPPSWSESSKQVRGEGATGADTDDVYLAPKHLEDGLVEIPDWGLGQYTTLVASDAGDMPRTLKADDPGSKYPIPEGCTAPTDYDPVAPGKYDLIETSNATGKIAQRWLCPGVYHFVHKATNPTNPQGLSFGSGTVIAGDGVTLVFDNDSELRIDTGATLVLNQAAAAPWMTGELMHDVPLPIWIQPMAGCTVTFGPSCDGSDVFTMSGGAGIDVRGIIFGPTDNMKIAGNDDHHGAGELWAWTLEYLGNSKLDQVYEGSAEGYPVIVE